MYQAGDLIVYGGEGVCRVETVGPIHLRGVSADRDYYTLTPLYREGKIYVPVDTKIFMRPIISRQAAMALIRSIPEIRGEACSQQSLRLLSEHYQALIDTHQCEDMVQIIKSAYSRGQLRHAQGNKPGQVDERYRKRAEDLLHGELAAALGIRRDAVADYIARVLEEEAALTP